MSYQDRQLTCVECGQPFTFTADDQAYHAERGFANDPKRCPDCRAARRGDRGDQRGSRSGYESGGGRAMYDVTCGACGKATQVPFQPRGDRPVYCSDCFRQQGGGRSDGGRSDGGRSDGGRRGARSGGSYGRSGRY